MEVLVRTETSKHGIVLVNDKPPVSQEKLAQVE
jgi:hypothetical protein